jgi:hypothetical protein
VPDDGWSRGLFVALAVAYVLVAAWLGLRGARVAADVPAVAGPHRATA